MEDQARRDVGWLSRLRAPGALRAGAPWLALASIGPLTLAWLGLADFAWNDYDNEARASVTELVHGHLGAFFELAPVYGGSLLERAPFALAPSLWGGGDLAVYRMLALPCLLASVVLGLWLVARMGRDGASPSTKALTLIVCTANPLTLLALEIGHPDELLGGALCVGAVLLAVRGRVAWAALALGLAIANKQWALLALGPVLIALPSRRALCASLAAAAGGALLAPFALFGASRFQATVHAAATSASGMFQPWQVWWFFGRRVPVTGALSTANSSGRVAPHWLEAVSHPLILAIAVPIGYAVWASMRRLARSCEPHGLGASDGLGASGAGGAHRPVERQHRALALLALLLLLRCMLDPWDNIYYPIPFVLALASWEALGPRRAPLLAFGATVAVWGGHHWMATFASPDAQAAFFVAWTAPLAAGLALACLRPATGVRKRRELFDGRQLLGQLGQHLVPVGGDRHQILDADAQGALQVDAGLDRHHLAGR